jgi:thiol-disulfide isomerase/thioredoxin
MRIKVVSFASLAVLAAVHLGACGSDPAPPDKVNAGAHQGETGGTGTGGTTGTAGTDAAGGAAGDTGTGGALGTGYPAGPFGNVAGTVIINQKFDGLLNPESVGYQSQGKTTLVQLKDFYNPTKDKAKPRVLLVMIGALWCGPCRSEAEPARGYHEYWFPKGVEFMHTVFEAEDMTPAKYADLDSWTKDYKLNYPSVLDPTPAAFSQYFTQGFYPQNMIIDLTTMKIHYIGFSAVDWGPDSTLLKEALAKADAE